MSRLPLRSVFILSGLTIACYAIAGCDGVRTPPAATVSITPPLAIPLDPTNVPAFDSGRTVIEKISPTPCTDAPPSWR